MGPFGFQELMVILIIVLLLFGAKKLPELARGLGKSIHEFKRAQDEVKEEFDKAVKGEEKATEKEDSQPREKRKNS